MKFYSTGIEFWDSGRKEYGGHSHWIAKLFNYRINYFYIGLCTPRIGYTNEYYDGNHHAIWLGFVVISYGT